MAAVIWVSGAPVSHLRGLQGADVVLAKTTKLLGEEREPVCVCVREREGAACDV